MPQNFRPEISAGNIGNTRGQIYVLLPAGRKSGKKPTFRHDAYIFTYNKKVFLIKTETVY